MYSIGFPVLVELQRQVMNKLAEELAERGYELPKTFYWHFDNSGENKNKEMIAFASLLVEMEFVDEVQLNFLCVGHTHCNLDQVCAPCWLILIFSPLLPYSLIHSHSWFVRTEFLRTDYID